MSDVLLSTREAAVRLRRSEQWVRNAARDGDLPAMVEHLRGGRTRYRFAVESIQQYLATHSAAITAAQPTPVAAPAEASTTVADPRHDTAGTDSLWIDHYREEITRYRLKVAELERTIDELIVNGDEKDDEIRRLCGVVRSLLPDGG